MTWAIGDTYRATFSTVDAGSPADADSLPTGVLRVNSTDTATSVTVTDLGTGFYEASCSLAGRANGDVCEVVISATIDSTAWEQGLGAFRVDAAVSSRLATTGYTAPPTVAGIRAEIDSSSTQLAAIVADTNELQTNQGNWLTATGFLTSLGTNAPVDWINSAAIANDAIGADQLADNAIAKIEAAMINEGDGQQLVDAIVQAIGNNNVDEAALVVAIKAALFDASSTANKLAVNGSGEVIPSNMTTPPTAAAIRAEIDSNSTQLADIKTVTEKLDGTLEDDGGTHRFTTNALEQAPSGSGGNATEAKQDTIITNQANISSAISSLDVGSDTGTGPREIRYLVTDGSEPLQNVWVYLTEGITTLKAKTDASGIAQFNNVLDATYDVVAIKTGYNHEGETLEVTSNATPSLVMTQTVVSAPSDPALITCTGRLLSHGGGVNSSTGTLRFKMEAVPTSDKTGETYIGEVAVSTFGSDGSYTVELLRDAQYKVYYKSAANRNHTLNTFTTDDAASMEIPSFAGPVTP